MASITSEPCGATKDGRPLERFTLRNGRGAVARVMTYGGIVTSLAVPDRAGTLDDVVLGFDRLDDYLNDNRPYFGCLVGRCANRIAGGRFTLAGTRYTLACNGGAHHLHGGVRGFDKVVWNARPIEHHDGPAIELEYLSPDGEEGYPGNLQVTAVYALSEDNVLLLDLRATTDRVTLCNLTHHSYFNLGCKGDIFGHELSIHAGRMTPVDATLIPTGELRPVDGTPFDFRMPTAIGSRIGNAGGYDHNWVLDKPSGELAVAARVREPESGRVLEVSTTEPGLQVYTANGLGGVVGKGGRVYGPHAGVCLEPQHFPDSPNQAGFPSTVLAPGETYRSTIVYRFSVE